MQLLIPGLESEAAHPGDIVYTPDDVAKDVVRRFCIGAVHFRRKYRGGMRVEFRKKQSGADAPGRKP